MKRFTSWIQQRLRRAGHASGGEAPARPSEEQESTQAWEGRVRQLERDSQDLRALAAEVERLARERGGMDVAAPAPSASTASLLAAARDRLQTEPSAAPGAAADAWPKETVSALIKIRDDLLAAMRHGGDGATMARWAYEQLGGVLKLEGVEPLEDMGLFDPRRQEAIETRQTGDAARDRTVAATVRPGYATGGTLIRAQAVVVYALHGDARPSADPLRPNRRNGQ